MDNELKKLGELENQILELNLALEKDIPPAER